VLHRWFLRGGGLLGWLLFGRNPHDFQCLDCSENQGGCALNDFQALGQKCRVSVVKMDVVGGGVSCVQSDGPRDNESDCLGFRLAYRLGGSRAARAFV